MIIYLCIYQDWLEIRLSLQIQLKSLAEEMQAIIKGLEKVKKELEASETDGPVSEIFRKVLWWLHFLFFLIMMVVIFLFNCLSFMCLYLQLFYMVVRISESTPLVIRLRCYF